jgi:hypothetical protein
MAHGGGTIPEEVLVMFLGRPFAGMIGGRFSIDENRR